MNTQGFVPGDILTVWDHKFQWTEKHFAPEQLMPLRQQADDLALAALERLQAVIVNEKQNGGKQGVPHTRPDLYATLKEHYQDDGILRQFWEEANSVPEWVDWEEIEKGQVFLYRYLGPNITGLVLQSFLGENATTAGTAEVLIKTGGFSTRILPKRFLETFQWLLQVTLSLKAIQPGGEGHISSIRVRLLHAMVRQRILKLVNRDPNYFDSERYGTPINLLDSMHAICVFCCNPMFIQLPKIGIQPDPYEVKGYMALFRYVAYLLGTPTEYFATIEQAKATMESIMLSESGPTPSSKIIALNFIEAIRDFPGVNVSRSLIAAGCRSMNGDRLSDQLGLSKPGLFFKALFQGYCSLLVAIVQLQRWFPSLDRVIISKSKKFFLETVFRSSILKGGTKFDFAYIPDLKRLTKIETRAVRESGLIRAVETISFISFIVQILVYLVPILVLGMVFNGVLQDTWSINLLHPWDMTRILT